MTCFRRDAAAELTPFPPLRYGWGARPALVRAGRRARLAAGRGRFPARAARAHGRRRLVLVARGDRGGETVPRGARLRRQPAGARDPSTARAPGGRAGRGGPSAMRVCVVAEFYPRRRDPVLGVWAHRQALAARDAGADVRVLALERPVPAAAALRAAGSGRPGRLARELRARSRSSPPATFSTGWRWSTCASCRRRGSAPTAAGTGGRAARCSARSSGCTHAGRSTSCTPTTRTWRPPRRGPGPRRGACRSRCRCTAAICSRPRSRPQRSAPRSARSWDRVPS